MIDRMSAVRRRLRPALLFGVATALLGIEPLSAQAIAGHSSNAPVNFSADRIEMQDRADRVVLAGHVDVTQDNLRLRADRVTVNYTNAGSLQVQRMIANGGVFVTRGSESAHGDAAVYDLNQSVITMAGNVSLKNERGTLNGGRVVMNLKTGRSSVDGAATNAGGIATTSKGGRVSGTFSVPKHN
jgi:lipopolysaccharide export system protein LptA